MSRLLKRVLAVVIFLVAVALVWNLIGALFHVAIFLVKALLTVVVAAIIVGIFAVAVRTRE